MVEMALVLPFVLLVLGTAYTGWDAMHRTIGLTSAARAGTISAANDLQNGKSCTTALTDATSAVNAEEGFNHQFTHRQTLSLSSRWSPHRSSGLDQLQHRIVLSERGDE